MATVNRFEDLTVWNAATDLAVSIFKLTEAASFRFKGDLVNQLRRAALSVANNIAEGFERGTTSELLTFLYISRGSAGEVRSMLRFALRLGEMTDCTRELESLARTSESVSRLLFKWIETLKNGKIEGQRRLTDKSRAIYEADRRRAQFSAQLDAWRADMERKVNERVFGKNNSTAEGTAGAGSVAVEMGAGGSAGAGGVMASVAGAGGSGAGSSPKCPECGRDMVRRKSRDGKFFWGCSGYPQCRGSRSV